MTCPDCTAAATRLWHAYTAAQCCKSRAVARSLQFSESWRQRRQTREYRQILSGAGVTHEQVTAAAKNDRACDRLLGKVPA